MLQPIDSDMSSITIGIFVNDNSVEQLLEARRIKRPAGICYQIPYSQGITRHVFTYFLWYQSALPVVSSTTKNLSPLTLTIIPVSSGKHESCITSPIFTIPLLWAWNAGGQFSLYHSAVLCYHKIDSCGWNIWIYCLGWIFRIFTKRHQ